VFGRQALLADDVLQVGIAGYRTFGFGIHRCLGSHLARREIVSAIQAWMKLMPPFRLANNEPPRSSGPAIVGLSELQLAWN
jgi:cytochrome P450